MLHLKFSIIVVQGKNHLYIHTLERKSFEIFSIVLNCEIHQRSTKYAANPIVSMPYHTLIIFVLVFKNDI